MGRCLRLPICLALAAAVCPVVSADGRPAERAAEVFASLTYVGPEGSRTTAVAFLDDGTAAVQLRGQTLRVTLPAAVVTRLKARLSAEALGEVSQSAFDRCVADGAAAHDLRLPIPLADRCELRLPGGRVLSAEGSAVLAGRMPEVQAVADFERLRTELEQMSAVVVLGGLPELRTFFEVAGEAAGRTVRLSDLSFADRFGGRRVAHFTVGRGLLVVTAEGDERPVAKLLQTAMR